MLAQYEKKTSSNHRQNNHDKRGSRLSSSVFKNPAQPDTKLDWLSVLWTSELFPRYHHERHIHTRYDCLHAKYRVPEIMIGYLLNESCYSSRV